MVVFSLLLLTGALLSLCIFHALIVSRALHSTVLALDRAQQVLVEVHSGDMQQLSEVLDRVMADDFAAFRSFQLAEGGVEGGVEELSSEERVQRRPWLAQPPPEDNFDPETEGLPR